MPSLSAAFRREDGQNKDAFLGINLRQVIGPSHDTSKDNKIVRVRDQVPVEIFGDPSRAFEN